MERAADAGGTRHWMIGILAAEPRDTIAAVPRGSQVENERVAQRDPVLPALPHAAELVGGDAHPLLDVHPRPRALAWREPSDPAELLADRVELVLARTLPPDHALPGSAVDEIRHGGPALSCARKSPDMRAQGVGADIPRRHAMERHAGGPRMLLEPGEVCIHGGGLPARIGKNGGIQPRQLAAERAQEQRRRLHARPEREYAEGTHHAQSARATACNFKSHSDDDPWMLSCR